MKTKITQIMLSLISTLFLLAFFQNCARVKFSTDPVRATSAAGFSVPPQNAADIIVSDTNCLFNGTQYVNGQTILAFQNSSVVFGQSCVSEVRKCEVGVLSGSFSYATCSVGVAQSCLFDGRTIAHGSSVQAAQNSTVPFGQSCNIESRTCNNGILSGSFNFSNCAVMTASSCLFDGQTISHATTVKGFLTSTVPFGQMCVSEDRACNNGILSGSYTFGACNEGAPSSCLFNGKTVAHGEQVTGFQTSSKNFGETCTSEVRTCNNGLLSGSFGFPTCSIGAAASCVFNGSTVAHGSNVPAYSASNVNFGQLCMAQLRECNNGVLSGTAIYGSCVVDKPLSCLFNGITVPDGGDIPGFFTSTVAFGQTCVSEKKICKNGILSGESSNLTCTVTAPLSCNFNGTSIANGETAPAFDAATVPFGQACVAKSRLCSNGILSGTGAFSSCSVLSGAACLLNGIPIDHGSSRTTFQNPSVAFGSTCNSETRICANGTLSGSFTAEKCTVAPPASCNFNGQVISNGGSVTSFATSLVAYGQSCSPQLRTCNNGILSGSASSGTCSVAGPAACYFNGSVIGHGGSLTAYATSAVAFGGGCSAETRSCNNGVLSGSYSQSSCAAAAPANCSFNGTFVPHGGAVTAFGSAEVAAGQACAAEARTCYNGSLSGSYVNSSCVHSCEFMGGTGIYATVCEGIRDAQTCSTYETQAIMSLRHGESRDFFPSSQYSLFNIFYQGQTVACPARNAIQRTCLDGSLSGDAAFIYPTCSITYRDAPSPLMIHFNSDLEKIQPLEFSSQKNGINFDILGINSSPVPFAPKRISWYKSPQYYFLALPNSKGEVNGINELFGDNTFGRDNQFAADGYKALAKFDGKSLDLKSNVGLADGLITKDDLVFNKLRLWHDKNHDGKAQSSELFTLQSMGVEIIDLNADAGYKEVDKYGNKTTLKSVVKTVDGRYHLMFDVWFSYKDLK